MPATKDALPGSPRQRSSIPPYVACLIVLTAPNWAAEPVVETLDTDPGWDGHNNRSTTPEVRVIRQDFGYRPGSEAGQPGTVGGFITPAAEPAYYIKSIPALSFDDVLEASGRLVVGRGDEGAGNTLVGFFNTNTVNEWRTPNSIAMRIYGRGSGFHCHLEYATAKWRAGGNFFSAEDPATGKNDVRLIAHRSSPHTWNLRYDPAGNQGEGTISLTLDDETLILNLDPGHKADGATFNGFGLLNVVKSADGGGVVWLESLKINGIVESFDRDPEWQAFQNRRTYTTTNVRPRFDFGYSQSHYAGGKMKGEIGGLIFRGDQRYPERMAYYGARVEAMTLDNRLAAGGKVVLRRAVTDSTVLFGYFHATDSMASGSSQASGFPESFLGLAIEGPSREGFLFYPVYGVDREAEGANGSGHRPPYIYPDGKSHDWTLNYDPDAARGRGRITLTLDGGSVSLDLAAEHRALGARFNRFGIITTHVDGNGQLVFFDDLTYTRMP